FRQYCVDEHARSQFEARDSGEPRNHADIPMKVPRTGILGRATADGEVEVRVSESHVNLGQQGSQNASQIRNLRIADVSEARHVAERKDMGRKWRGRGENLHGHEVFALDDDKSLVLDLA